MKELAKAILVAMKHIGYLQKDKTVGTGANAYKALSDNKATQGIREALIQAGIVALPISVQATERCAVTVWQDTNNYGTTTKTHVFTEVIMTIELIHAESGESRTIQALGHGIDNGDKSAGKSMTYAKKNALLNALLISSGLDADDTHSDDLPQPQKQAKKAPSFEEDLAKANGKASVVAKHYAKLLGVEPLEMKTAEDAHKAALMLYTEFWQKQ